MAVYLVTWDLNKEKSNYAEARAQVIARLQRYQHTKDPGLDSVWFLDGGTWSAEDVFKDIKPVFDDNDRFIITRIREGEKMGWLGQNVWAWINSRL
ncbi:hypothetical protein A2389_02545 [Candidatus Adlerbacteria bacterium RIFOXYB1_FULL_48_10]|nr:MAG: hypothetical protein A2389_02545 [Candidatus Adlerbacteria bacterium RIFOXYB1_FULL_48_10]OGC95031.1 MAG: hypothetical protein A2590_01980 [Candidatus Adlerbacteria bacterium RIFOXYD1_FULL_48_8]